MMSVDHGARDAHRARRRDRPSTTAESFLPDVVLLDIGLPKLNGYEVAQRIREQPVGRIDVPDRRHGMGTGRGSAAFVRSRIERAHGQTGRAGGAGEAAVRTPHGPSTSEPILTAEPLRTSAKVRNMLSCHGQAATHAYVRSTHQGRLSPSLWPCSRWPAAEARRRRCLAPRRKLSGMSSGTAAARHGDPATVRRRSKDRRGVAAVARRGKLVYLEPVGLQSLESRAPMTERSLFRIYSMTKAVTAVCRDDAGRGGQASA